MAKWLKICLLGWFAVWISVVLSTAGELGMDTIRSDDSSWKYFSDQVMGGRSQGKAELLSENSKPFLRMKGIVTVENNGGFIQIRSAVGNLKKTLEGIEIKVRGNGERYYVFVRTTSTILPWQYYKAPFETKADWDNVQLKFSEFDRSSAWLKRKIAPDSIKSIGIVAFGRNHEALIDVSEIKFF
tara:strand:- start:204 stop:758 length:555 start_codon:yes stop_codon:yes gene_type:complete